MRIYKIAGIPYVLDAEESKENNIILEIKAIILRNLKTKGGSSVDPKKLLIRPFYDASKKIISLSIGIILESNRNAILEHIENNLTEIKSLVKNIVGVTPEINIACDNKYTEQNLVKYQYRLINWSSLPWGQINWKIHSDKAIANRLIKIIFLKNDFPLNENFSQTMAMNEMLIMVKNKRKAPYKFKDNNV